MTCLLMDKPWIWQLYSFDYWWLTVWANTELLSLLFQKRKSLITGISCFRESASKRRLFTLISEQEKDRKKKVRKWCALCFWIPDPNSCLGDSVSLHCMIRSAAERRRFNTREASSSIITSLFTKGWNVWYGVSLTAVKLLIYCCVTSKKTEWTGNLSVPFLCSTFYCSV